MPAAHQRSRQGVRTSLVSPPPLAPPSLLSSLPPLCRPAVWIAHMAGTPCPERALLLNPILLDGAVDAQHLEPESGAWQCSHMAVHTHVVC